MSKGNITPEVARTLMSQLKPSVVKRLFKANPELFHIEKYKGKSLDMLFFIYDEMGEDFVVRNKPIKEVIHDAINYKLRYNCGLSTLISKHPRCSDFLDFSKLPQYQINDILLSYRVLSNDSIDIFPWHKVKNYAVWNHAIKLNRKVARFFIKNMKNLNTGTDIRRVFIANPWMLKLLNLDDIKSVELMLAKQWLMLLVDKDIREHVDRYYGGDFTKFISEDILEWLHDNVTCEVLTGELLSAKLKKALRVVGIT